MLKLAVLLAMLALPAGPTRYVTDAANVLDDAREQALNERLAQYQRDTSNQVIVYVDRKVPEGTTLEEMGAEAIRTWAVGQERQDNGAILFLFIDDRESRIEVGYGLEGTLTDAASKRILVDLRPQLRDADYIGAVEQGAERIIATIADPQAAQEPQEAQAVAVVPAPEPSSGSDSSDVGSFFAVVFLGFIVIVILAMVRKGMGLTPSTDSSSSSDDWSSSSSDFSSSSSSFDSSSSSSDSSSSFSGGGGSGGGGGASDKW